MRLHDAHVPPAERLYRSFAPTAYTSDGDHLLAEALDLPSTSCNRDAYAPPESVLIPGRPRDTGIAWISGEQLPTPEPSPGGVSYGWRVDDVPRPENEAHAEVRLCRAGVYEPGHTTGSKVYTLRLREQLANRFRVLDAPIPFL